MDKNNLSLYLICLIELEKIDKKLFGLYGESTDLFNHKIGVYKIFRKVVANCRFVYETSEISSKQVAISLTRMVIDQYSVVYLLSCYSTRKEQKLRYFLYLMDSLSSRIRTITDFSNHVKGIDAKILADNIKSNTHDQDAIEKLMQIIAKEKLNTLVEDSVIRKYNWKFMSNHPANNKRDYSWKELYNIARIPHYFSDAIQSHFSAFTHGLSMAILYAEDRPEATFYVYEFINIIQSLMGKVMLLNYPEELKDLELNDVFVELGEECWNNWK